MIENLTDLKYFLEVATTGNVTRASERLGISQPSLSLALQRIESKMGVRLLERSRTGVHLTRQGETLARTAARMLLDWERELRMIAQDQEDPMGIYSIGMHISVARYTLPHFLPGLLERFKGLEINLKHDLSRKVTEQVISRECDFGLVINPIPHPDLIMHKLLTDEVTLFRHTGYKGDVLIFDPALKQSLGLMKNLRKSFDYKRQIHSSSLEVILSLCEASAGVAILPKRVVAGSEKIRPIPSAPVFKDELFLIYRMEKKREKSFRPIIEAIKGAF